MEDCVQDIFVDVWLYRKSLNPTVVAKTYLISCVRKRITRMYERDRMFRKTSRLDELVARLGVLTKFYMMTKQWDKAASTAKQIMDGNQYILWPDYTTLFAIANKGNSEMIFVYPCIAQSGYGNVWTANALPPQYPTPVFNTATQVCVPVLLRYADILLCRAEALVMSSGTVSAEALSLLNQIRTRAGLAALTAADTPDKTAFIDALIRERGWEFYSEGKRREDLIRQDMFIANAISRGQPAKS